MGFIGLGGVQSAPRIPHIEFLGALTDSQQNAFRALTS